MSAIVERLRAAINASNDAWAEYAKCAGPPEDLAGFDFASHVAKFDAIGAEQRAAFTEVAAEIDRLTRERDARPTEAQLLAAILTARGRSAFEGHAAWDEAIDATDALYRRKAEQP